MSKRPDIGNVTSGFRSQSRINSNLAALQEGFDNTLSRDGSAPNEMLADLDMNGNDILNANTVRTGNLYLDGELVTAESLVGPQGPTGPTGPQGPQGPAGSGVDILGSFETEGELPGSGDLGDAYLVDGDLYVWTGSAFENVGPIQGPAGPTGPQGPAGGIEAIDVTEVKYEYKTVSALLADTRNYTFFTAGDRVIADGYHYNVLASGASSGIHLTNAGGVKFEVTVVNGTLNLKAFNPNASGSADTSTMFQAAIDKLISAGGGGTLLVPAGTYRIDSTVNLGTDVTIVSNRDAIIELGTNGITMFRGQNLFRVVIDGLLFRNPSSHATGNAISLETTDRSFVKNCDFNSMPSSNNGTVRLLSCAWNWVYDNWFFGCLGNAMCDIGTGGTNNTFSGNSISNGGGFGIYVAGTSQRCKIINNQCITNTLELVGIAVGSNYCIVSNNTAEGCGDNGISVTSNYNTIIGNICRNNDLTGIFMYGSFNTCTGNLCLRNGQAAATSAGIAVQPAFGGSGQNNTIVGNTVDDDQSVPTQNNSVRILASSYAQWASGESITAGNYRFNGIRIYQATTSGTTGATAPTHSSGTASDGGVTWSYVNFFRTSAETRGNVLTANKFGASVSSSLLNQQDAGLEPLSVEHTNIQFNGGQTVARRVTEASTTVTSSDYLIGVRSSSAWTITLPATSGLQVGRVIIVSDETGQAGANNITISGNGNNIEGSASIAISTSYGSRTLYWTGVQWITI